MSRSTRVLRSNIRSRQKLLSSPCSMWATIILALSSACDSSAFSSSSSMGWASHPATYALRTVHGAIPCRTVRAEISRSRMTLRRDFRRSEHDEDEQQQQQQDTFDGLSSSQRVSRWWNSVFQGPVSDDSTKDVDEYLEFLDRRYHRLHDKPETAKKFSAWNWLTDKSTDEPVSEQEKDDALFVLGVAGLASEKLLMKHHISLPPGGPSDLELSYPGSIMTTHSRPSFESNPISPVRASIVTSSPILNVSASVIRQVRDGRRQLINFQSRKFMSAALLVVRTAVTLPVNIIKMVWHMGGGKKTLTLTCCALVSALVVMRPLAQAIIKQNSLHG